MGISGKFLKLWQKHFMVISTSAYSFVLVVLEHSIDPNFKCPEDEMQTLDYSLCYILLPPAALFLLGLAVQLPMKWEDPPCCECSCSCRHFCGKLFKWINRNYKRVISFSVKAFVPALLWLIIVLLDGKYIDCLCKSPRASCPAAMTPYHVSQIAGLGLVGCIALVGFIYWCCKSCCRKRVTMNVFQSRERLRVQATDYLDKQQNEAIQQLIEKHLRDHYLTKPETFVTGLSDEDVSFEIKRALNILWENQTPSDGAQSGESGAGGAQSGESGAGRAQGRAQSAPSSPSLQGVSSSRGHPSLASRETQNAQLSEGERTPEEDRTPVPAPATSHQTSRTWAQPPTKSTKKQSGKDKRTHPEADNQQLQSLLACKGPSPPRPEEC